MWARCLKCRSVFLDITPARFQQIHDESFQDTAHIESTVAFAGQRPLRAVWDFLALPVGSVLEIGPGSGHLLAAAKEAGCSVEAVESSTVHRDFIREAWGIEPVYAAMEEIPGDRAYDTIVAINVFEHVYDIIAFLRAVRRVLAPGGTFYLSAPNAISLEATILGAWWSMCGVHDHVSLPSPVGLSRAARESGLRVGRIWSTGLPCEFPVSTAIAMRDRARARRGAGKPARGVEASAVGGQAGVAGGQVPGGAGVARKRALGRFYSVAAWLDPSYRVLGALGRAGSIKARLIH
jgi:SAM-dependent methyltransferase